MHRSKFLKFIKFLEFPVTTVPGSSGHPGSSWVMLGLAELHHPARCFKFRVPAPGEMDKRRVDVWPGNGLNLNVLKLRARLHIPR